MRLVLADGVDRRPRRLTARARRCATEPVAPRFEDSFIAMLHERPGIAGNVDADRRRRPLQHGARRRRPVIEVHDLQRRFGDFYAVKDISFEVRRGEVFGLLGANGAGKSTTFRMLCGLLPASGGKLQVAGVDLRRAAAGARAAHRLHVPEVLPLRQPERARRTWSSSAAPTA